MAEYNEQIDSEYEKAVQEYNEIIAYNEEAATHNAKEDEKVKEVAAYNQEEQSRVDAINQELQDKYESELAIYNDKITQEPEEITPKYIQETNGKTTLYYDTDGNLVLKSVAGNTAKDDVITYENVGTNEHPIWSNKYNYRGDNLRYVNFSIIATIGKTTTGTDWDNDASKYSNKVYSTIADLNDVTSKPLDFSDEGEGRNLINYKTANIGLELCDSIIRTITNTPISTYYNESNGNAAAGKEEMHITFKDFPSNAKVFTSLQTNGSKFYDPDTGQQITGEDINSGAYTLCWFSVKYQKNGWRVSGVLLKNGVIVAPEIPVYITPELQEYTPQYMELIEKIEIPIKGAYLEFLNFIPKEEEKIIVESAAGPTSMEPAMEPAEALAETPQVQTVVVDNAAVAMDNTQTVSLGIAQAVAANDIEVTQTRGIAPGSSVTKTSTPLVKTTTIEDNANPLASGIENETNNWALLNLIFMLVNILMLVIIPRNNDKEDKDKKQYRTNIIGVILALLAVVVFILTENVYMPMVIVDQWTILMGAFVAGGILTKIFGHKKEE